MRRPRLVVVVSLALAALAAGCANETTDGESTPIGASTPTTVERADATATSTPDSMPAPDIRAEDLALLPALQAFIGQNGGEVDAAEVIYADLTGNGAEEAVVPVSSGGTLGNLAVFVFGYRPDGLRTLLEVLPPEEARGGHMRAEVESGQLLISWSVYGPDDANCCPSGGTRARTYGWDGNALVLDDETLTMP